MILGVHHIGVIVSDRDATKWLDHIGVARGAWMACPNVYIHVARAVGAPARPQPRPVNLPGIAHICLQSRDIDEGVARGTAAGLTPISGPVDLGTPFRYLYAHTRDGILLELEGAPFVRDEDPRFWVGHVAFVAVDIEPLVNFYGRALGLKPSQVSRFNANARIDRVAGLTDVDLSAMWLPGFNLGLEFWQYHHPRAPRDQDAPTTGFGHLCFECDDFDADCARVFDQGGSIDTPTDFGLSKCKTAAFKDIEGNRFVLIAFDDQDDPMSIKNLSHKDLLAAISGQLVASQLMASQRVAAKAV